MQFDIPELNEIKEIVTSLKNTFEKSDFEKKDSEFTKTWYNTEQCWALKGGMALNTFKCNRFYQCKGGIPDGYVGGRKVWSRESVMEWLPLTDDKLPEYHNKYKTGAVKK